MSTMKLGELLAMCGIIEKVQLWEALERQKKEYQPLGRILIEMGAITEQQLNETLEFQVASFTI